ncbi:acetyl-CoA C-acetyltransferase [Georgenia muralis]
MSTAATSPAGDLDVVVVGAARTPQGRLNGALAQVAATGLGSVAVAGALARGGVPPEAVEAVILGQVLQAGVGQNPARQAAIGAGVPWSAHTTTVNKVCLSGLTAVIDAARLIRSGEAGVVVAGGMESMSRAPHLLLGSRSGWTYGDVTAVDHLAHDGLTDAFESCSMGLATDARNASTYPVTREDQDAVAAASHQRAARAWDEGVFDDEVVPVTVTGRKGETVVERDEGIRPDTTTETLARLRPAFSPTGSITAGNASQISDGAAALVLTTRGRAREQGWTVLATLRAAGQVAGPDTSLHAQPARALDRALERQGWTVADLDLVEINEAFAAVVVHSTRELGADPARVNPHGGGISLGHPIGASGARLLVHAVHQVHRSGHARAGVALCGGGGQGEALLLEG